MQLENVIHIWKKKKKQSIEIDPEMTEVMELAEKKYKTTIINMLRV